jgi:hypothetical protein
MVVIDDLLTGGLNPLPDTFREIHPSLSDFK